ncbi:ankyrin repeat domain-containing protein 26 isoform X5 [Dunckerocampus dactyliophorus]|uniref:ankyrin repeat domain-containing protein 26 isoform X5 n=1 Tax=Dunckerocampus dactyliophorus TaxID=161453 RepID=UPI00240706E7|nr:ankyrin repeat domain-containing protein 26 isoform X5 [Dunckerocampus dactyliophorus]
MKKLFSFSKRKQSPSGTPNRANVVSVGYEVKEKDLGKFHKAAWKGDVSKLEHLVKSNDVNQADKQNRTALHIACASGNSEVVKLLVEKKAKLNLCDNESRTALMKAVQGQHDVIVNILLENNADANLMDVNGNTALHLASIIPSISIVDLLVKHDADINVYNKEGLSPLTVSVQEDHLEVAEFLLKNGADVNILDKDHRSPLMIAAGNGQISMVRMLLQFDADSMLKDNKGQSAEDYAAIESHHPCALLIAEHGTKRNQAASLSHPGPSKKRAKSEMGNPSRGLNTDLSVGGPALDKDDFEDNSQAESLSRLSKKGGTDEWASSEEDCESLIEEKTPPKMNLRKMLESKRGKAERLSSKGHPLAQLSGSQSSSESDAQSSEDEGSDEEDDDDDEDDEEEDYEESSDEESEEIEEEEDSCLASVQSNSSSVEDAQKLSLLNMSADSRKAQNIHNCNPVNSASPHLGVDEPQENSGVDQDCVVSAVRVDSRYSDEDDSIGRETVQSREIIQTVLDAIPASSQRNVVPEGERTSDDGGEDDRSNKEEKRRSSWGSSLEDSDIDGSARELAQESSHSNKGSNSPQKNNTKEQKPPEATPKCKSKLATDVEDSNWDSPSESDDSRAAGGSAKATPGEQFVGGTPILHESSEYEDDNNTGNQRSKDKQGSKNSCADKGNDCVDLLRTPRSLKVQSSSDKMAVQVSLSRLPKTAIEADEKFIADGGDTYLPNGVSTVREEENPPINVDVAVGRRHSYESLFSEALPHTDIDDVDLDSPDEVESLMHPEDRHIEGVAVQKKEPSDADSDDSDNEEEEEEQEQEPQEDILGDQSEGSGDLLHVTPGVPERDVPKDMKRDLGLEKKEEDSWDSEHEDKDIVQVENQEMSGDTGEKLEEDLLYIPSFLRGGKWMPEPWWSRGGLKDSLREEGLPSALVKNKHSNDAEGVQKEDGTQKESEETKWGLLLSKCEGKSKDKIDLMDELGLGEFDYAEDASDWDTSSNASKRSLPGCTKTSPTPKVPECSSKEKAVSPQVPIATPRKIGTSPHPQPRTNKIEPEESDKSDWDQDSSSSSCNEAKTDNHQSQVAVRPGSPELSAMASGDKEQQHKQLVKETAKAAVSMKTISEYSDTDGRASEELANEKPEIRSVSCKEMSRQAEASQQAQPPTTSESSSRALVESQLSRQRNSHISKAEAQAGGKPTAVSKTRRTPQTDARELSVFDDSTLSDVSEDEGRGRTGEEKKKQKHKEIEISEDLDELNSSSDMTTDDSDFATPGHGCGSLFIQNLDSVTTDSRSMVKLQNIFHKYERSIQKAKSRHAYFADKVSLLESEKAQLRSSLDEIKDVKALLERNRLELQAEVTNLKFQLRQEQENGHNATMMYNTTGDKLRRTEEQRQVEVQEKQKVELTLRNLELEMRILLNSKKQLEEDHSQTQTLLAQERSARTVLENLLNNHVRKQQEIEEENKRNISKSNEALSQLTEASDRERELLQQISIFQEQLSKLRTDLESSQASSSIKQRDLQEENKALKEQLDEARRALKVNSDALNQSVLDFNNQTATLKSELTVTATRLENERQSRETMAVELESVRTRLTVALQEAERCMGARSDTEKALLWEKEEHHRLKERLSSDASSQNEAISSLSQKLAKAEAHANSMENQAHQATLQLTEKNLLLNTMQRENDQIAARVKDLEATLHAEKELVTRAGARQEATQERLAQAQSEGMLLRQQLEEAQNKGVAKENAVTDAQKSFTDILSKLRSDCEERIQLVQDRNQDLAAKAVELRERIHQLEEEKNDTEAKQRQLQQDLADSLKKLSMCEASLEINTRYRNDLEEEKTRLLKDKDNLQGKLEEREVQCLQAEKHTNELKALLIERDKEFCAAVQKQQEALSAAAASDITVKQLEEAVQRLEIENVRLEAAAKQQSNKLEALQKCSEEAAKLSDSPNGGMVRAHLEDLVTNLQSSKMTLEDQLSKEVQKQSLLSNSAQDSQAMWEEELKSRSKLGLRLTELEKEKGELTSQMEIEKKKAKKAVEQKKAVDSRLEQEMERNTALQKEIYRLRTVLKTAKKKLRDQDRGAGADFSSPMSSLRMELGRHSQTDGGFEGRKEKVNDLHGELERGGYQGGQLDRRLLEEEVQNLKRRVESSQVEQRQMEQYRIEIEEKARQEIRHKLQEVNLFLQSQAATQEAQDQIKATNEASLRLKIQELESELTRTRNVQHDTLNQRESTRSELERYKELYREEQKLRKSLSADLKRTNHQLTEASSRLVNEHSRSLIASTGPPGCVGSLTSAASILGSPYMGYNSRLLSPSVAEGQGSSVEDYLAMMQRQLDRSISRELNKASAELDISLARMSPVGSASRMELDPVSRAKQQYLEVLKKNHEV